MLTDSRLWIGIGVGVLFAMFVLPMLLQGLGGKKQA